MARYNFGGGSSDYAILPDQADGVLRFEAGATVTAWTQSIGGVQLTDLLLESTGQATVTLTSLDNGEIPRFRGPDGVTNLWLDGGVSSRRLYVTTDLGDLLYLKQDKGAAPAPHTHNLGDSPDVQRLLSSALLRVDYDTTTNTWPIIELPTSPIVWNSKGTGAAPPAQARGGYDYWQGPITGPTNVPDPTPEPDPEDPEEDPNGITLHAPELSANGTLVTATALVETSASTSFRYLQIAVRGPSGQVADTAHASDSTVDGELVLSGTFTAPAAGNWRAFATYNLTGGANQSDWIDGPAATVNISLPTPGDNTFPQAGFSGLPWNSGGFVSEQWNPAAVAAFGTYRGTPPDTMLVFAQFNTGWGGAGNPFGLLNWYDPWGTFPGIFILSMPPQPQGQNNSATAAGSNNARWRDFGSVLTSKGMNKPSMVIRLGWECNGNWYDWSWHKNGGPASYIAAFRNVVTSVHQTAPNVKFDLCLNKDWEHPSMPWRSVLDELAPYLDVVGFDGYDMWEGWRNDSGRRNAWYNKSGPQRDSVAAWCRANGKLMSLDEWGLVDIAAPGAGGTGGGDDQLYITDTWNWCVANQDVLAWESYYNDDGAPPDLKHKLAYYTNARAAYFHSSRWGGGN